LPNLHLRLVHPAAVGRQLEERCVQFGELGRRE
jgi:hypothetical protein